MTKKRFFGILLSLVLMLGLMPGMRMTAYADGTDNTNYDLKAVPTAQGLERMPGVYTVKATLNNSADNPATIGIPGIARQNLTQGATKELPAIVMGAAVNYEVRTGPTEFTPMEGAELLPPYSYFRWGVMDEQTKEADGTTTTHRKLSGFDGSYYIVRVDVSAIIEDAKQKAEAKGETLEGKCLHVRQQNNKALLVATGMTDSSFVYADTSQVNNKGGCKAAVYPLADDAAAMKDATGKDRETPYLDVILMSSAKNVAGADAGGQDAPVSNVDLGFYVDDTKDYKPWLQALDPNNMPTFPYTVKNDQGEDVTFQTEADYNTALTTKFFDEAYATEANSASYFKVMGEDLEIDVAIDNNEDVPGETGAGQSYRSINWLAEKMDFWSMEHAIAYQAYDNHTITLICEVPVLDALNISGTSERSVVLDVNSFDIQIANNTEQNKAGLTIGSNAQLRIKDGSNTAGAELAIGNNATMVIQKGGVMVIDETCTAEAEFDAASTVDPSAAPTEYLSGEITVQDGGKLINYGVINIEGTEGKPLDPSQQEQVIRDKKCAEILVESGGVLDNYGCLSLKGILYIMGTLNNYGQYDDILTAYDPDKNQIDYHRGIQVTWKDDVTQEGVEPGVLNVGIDAKGNKEPRAELNNYGDIVVVPGTFNLYGVFNNAGETEDRKGGLYAGHLYLSTVTEAIIPIVDPNDPLIVEKKVQLETPRESVFNNQGTVHNEGAIDSASVALIHNGVLGDLTPGITSTNKEVSYLADGIEIPVDGMFTIPAGAGAASYTVTSVTGEGAFAENKLSVTKCGSFLVTVNTAATETVPVSTAIATLTVNKADNPLTYDETQSVGKTFSTAAQTATLAEASNGQGDVSYAITSQKNGSNTEVEYFTLDGTTLTLAVGTPCDSYAVTVTATAAGNNNYKSGTKESIVLVFVGPANSAAATVTANNRTYDGTAQPLVTVTGTPTGGEMQYALGTATEATEQYTTSIPAKTEAGTYYVWYKVVGDDNHIDTDPVCVTATIYSPYRPTPKPETKYVAVEGEGAEYVQGSDGTLTFVFKRTENDETTYDHFVGARVDGRALTRDKDYTAKSGSVIIELTESFLKTLAVGEHILTAKFNDGADVNVTFVVEGSTPTPEPTPIKTLPFIDVNLGDWFYDSVEFVYDHKIMTGMTTTYFGAVENLSRAQFATILYRIAGEPDVEEKQIFPDVPINTDTKWYADAVVWANTAGVIKGYEDGTFGPADEITREQLATMLYRYAKSCGYDMSIKADFSNYPDAKDVSPWAAEAMQWAVGNGIIRGQGGVRLDPQGHATRAECAAMVERFMRKFV